MTQVIWQGETVAERYADMKDAYTRRAVSSSDTVVVLEDRPHTFSARMRVAHISACGWVDVFQGELDDNRDIEPDVNTHMALTPSQFSALMGAYHNWTVDKANAS